MLVRDLNDPTSFLNTSIPTSLSTKDDKHPLMGMIKTEEIEQYVK